MRRDLAPGLVMIAAPEHAFPRCVRLLAKAQFDAAFADGRRCASRYFRVSLTTAPGLSARLGLTVSRRVSKRAVERNRIKRCVRESFRHARSALPPLDLVLAAKPEAATAAGSLLRADLQQLWQRVAALKARGPTGTMRGAS